MGSSSMAARLSLLLLLSALLICTAATSQRREKNEEDVRQTRKQLLSVRDPRRNRNRGIPLVTKDSDDDKTSPIGRSSSRKNDNFNVGNRIATGTERKMTRTRSGKRIKNSRVKDQASDKFVPKLLNVMNISYMNSETFRSTQSHHDHLRRNRIGIKLKDNKLGIRRRVQKIKRRRIRVNPSQKPKSLVAVNNNNISSKTEEAGSSHNNDINLTTKQKSMQDIKWMWPPNTMDFSGFNFDLFDSQFAHKSPSSPIQNGFSKTGFKTGFSRQYSNSPQQVDMKSGRFTLTVLL